MDIQQLSVALRQAQGRIIGRAWEDQAFKAKLLSDPRAAIEQASGIKLPAGVSVKVLEETEDTLYFVIPSSPLSAVGYNAEGELSDEALAKVAGGEWVESGNRGCPTYPGYPDPSCG